MDKRIYRVLAYAGIESIVYQSMLFVHQIMLFRTLSTHLYGQIGILFSTVFLAVLYLNAGLDISLATLFQQAKQSKQHFYHLIIKQIYCNALFAIGALCIGYLIASSYITAFNSIYTFLLCAVLVIIESTKKTIKQVLHLSFFQRSVALTEIATLFLYVIIVWSFLLSGYTASITLVFIPFICISSVATLLYVHNLHTHYQTLINSNEPYHINWAHIVTMRFKNYIYQISHSLYSGNFLVPIIAAQYGFELAALLKVISMSAYSINSIIQHAFGITSNVFFAHMKNMHLIHKKEFFSKISPYIYHTLFVIGLMMFLHHRYIQFLDPNLCSDHIYIIYLFLLIIFSENIALTHEHFFIIEERTNLLIACNIGLLIPLLITQYALVSCSLFTLLCSLLCIRALSFLCISLYSWYAWKIRMSLGVKPLYLSASAALALICFLLS
ncbi:MAG: hypothetical protein WD055_05950 [Candidatus Dependentiae bacterium]